MEQEPKFGATGEFPLGKSRPDDKGELTMGIRANPGRGFVEVNFGDRLVAWMDLEPDVAENLGMALIAAAAKLRALTILKDGVVLKEKT